VIQRRLSTETGEASERGEEERERDGEGKPRIEEENRPIYSRFDLEDSTDPETEFGAGISSLFYFLDDGRRRYIFMRLNPKLKFSAVRA